MLSLEAFPMEPLTWWWPVRKCGREKVIEPMPITKMPGKRVKKRYSIIQISRQILS